MPMFAAATNQLRVRHAHEHHRVTYVELFFDLVFVFAITQLSHGLLEASHAARRGADRPVDARVWWVWIFTAWWTNWLRPRPARGAADALRADARRAGAVVRRSRARSRTAALRSRSPMCSCRSDATGFMLWALKRHDPANYPQLHAHLPLARCRGAVLDRGAFADGAARLGSGRSRLRSNIARRSSVSGCPASAARPPPTGRSRAATWRSAAACSSSSRSANRS